MSCHLNTDFNFSYHEIIERILQLQRQQEQQEILKTAAVYYVKKVLK